MKKLSIALILLLVINLIAVPVMAAQTAHMSVYASTSTVTRGQTFTVTISSTAIEDCTSGGFVFDFDRNVFEYVSGYSCVTGYRGSGVMDEWGYVSGYFMGAQVEHTTVQGTLFQVTFKVKENAAFGTHSIYGEGNANDVNGGVSCTAGSASITVVCSHNWGDWTKNDKDNHKHTCGTCGSVETADHSWDNGVTTTPANCKDTGVKTYTCTVCGETKTDTIPKTNNHNYGDWTKNNKDNHKHTCATCGNVETAGHSWNNGVITTPATCKDTGVKTYTCTVCGETKTDTIPKTTTHTYGDWVKENNSTHKRTCTVCSVPESANHTWSTGTITKAPTCKDTGIKTYTCTGCGTTKTDTVPKTTTHTYGNWVKENDNTHKHTCTVCGVPESANHTWSTGTVTKAPTCKAEGVKTYTCSVCNGTKTEAVPKTTTHTYGAWTKVDETTHKHTCTVCSVSESANHKWDNGKITKAPTCKDEGVKTYTCSDCNGTKTEAVQKTTTHTYGAWTNVDTEQHKHICQVCDKEETENHTWNSGVITTKPTCKDEGEKTYTCTSCNTTKTEVIEKLTTHTYDHDCDTDCNVCGVTRETTHQYKTTWSKDKNEHWHECSVCKDKKDAASHTPGAAATEYNPQTCTTCGYVIKAALGHKHKYATTWTTDEKGHWYVCSGCEEKGSYADHDFENDCDTDCSVCEYTREIEHAFEEKWVTDENGHWHVCSVCELKQDEAAHEPGAEATATTAQTCTICDYEIAPALGVPETTEAPTEAPTTEPETPAVDDNGDDQNQIVVIAVVAAVVVALVGMIVVLIAKKKKNS